MVGLASLDPPYKFPSLRTRNYFNAIPSIQMCSGGAPQESKLIVK
jgi:hypothetical protein